MEKDDITFPAALKQASDLERIARDSKLVGRGESSVSQVKSGSGNHRGPDQRGARAGPGPDPNHRDQRSNGAGNQWQSRPLSQRANTAAGATPVHGA